MHLLPWDAIVLFIFDKFKHLCLSIFEKQQLK